MSICVPLSICVSTFLLIILHCQLRIEFKNCYVHMYYKPKRQKNIEEINNLSTYMHIYMKSKTYHYSNFVDLCEYVSYAHMSHFRENKFD